MTPNTSVVVVADLDAPLPSPKLGTVYVRPGDVLVVGRQAVTPETQEVKTIRLDPNVTRTRIATADQIAEDRVVGRTLGYLPRGYLHAFFIPYPWAIATMSDLLAAPDMVLWYVMLVAAALGLWRSRKLWPILIVLVAFIGGTMTVFALAEGNYGTLFRHRSMVIPAVVVLASPSLVWWFAWLRERGASFARTRR